MSILKRLFGSRRPAPGAAAAEQAVLVHLDGVRLSDEVYEQHDLATLEDQLASAIEQRGLGEYDGNEVGAERTTLYMYGPDAEKLFAGVEPVLRAYPLCRGAHVAIRHGGPGSSQRDLTL
jgi:hypothetical protein